MKVLMVLTSHDQLGNTGRKTGFWLEELAAPYYVFKDAGVGEIARPLISARQRYGCKATARHCLCHGRGADPRERPNRPGVRLPRFRDRNGASERSAAYGFASRLT